MLIADAVERYGPYIYNIRIAAAASRPTRSARTPPKHPKRHIPKAPVLPDAFSFFAAALHTLPPPEYPVKFRGADKFLIF